MSETTEPENRVKGIPPVGAGDKEHPIVAEERTDPRRYALDSIPPEHREAARVAKADALHRLACEVQDSLNMVGIFYGDGPLLEAKKRIDDACTKARNVADKVRREARR